MDSTLKRLRPVPTDLNHLHLCCVIGCLLFSPHCTTLPLLFNGLVNISAPTCVALVRTSSSCAPNPAALLLACCRVEWLCLCWLLILCHVKPKTSFWSTVLQLACERRAWQGGNRENNYRLLKLIWKPGNSPPQSWDVQGLSTHSYQHCWSCFCIFRCSLVLVWALLSNNSQRITENWVCVSRFAEHAVQKSDCWSSGRN